MLFSTPRAPRQLFSLAFMIFLLTSLVAICAAASTLSVTLPAFNASPIVALDKGKFIGTTVNGINQFLGIPFARPPSVPV